MSRGTKRRAVRFGRKENEFERWALATLVALASLWLTVGVAWADKVTVLPFTGTEKVTSAELERVRAWTMAAVRAKGHTLATDSELLSAQMAVQDGVADTSEELQAAGRASGAKWTTTGQVERIDVTVDESGANEFFTLYRVEIEVCDVESGRVESVAREVDPDVAPDEIGDMIALLVRPEGLANAPIPWENEPRRKRAKKPPPAPPPPSAPAPAPAPAKPPPPPVDKRAFGVGVSAGFSTTIARPSDARGSSAALPIGATVAYAFAPTGLELRGVLTSQVAGPRAVEVAGGARYAFAVSSLPLQVGPELLIGAHVAAGADKAVRFLTRGSLVLALLAADLRGAGAQLWVEAAADLGAALGASGALVLTGGTGRVLLRF